MSDHLTISTHDEAEDLLKTYSVQEIVDLWADDAFGEMPKAVSQYVQTRINHGNLAGAQARLFCLMCDDWYMPKAGFGCPNCMMDLDKSHTK